MSIERCVVTLAKATPPRAADHEVVSHTALAQRLAKLLGFDFGGEYDAQRTYAGAVYFVPQETLTCDVAHDLGIVAASDLYGGVVPARFAATKAITHALP